MAGLAGDRVGVIVELDGLKRLALMGRIGVAALAGGGFIHPPHRERGKLLALFISSLRFGIQVIARPPAQTWPEPEWQAEQGHVAAVCSHMHVQINGRIVQRTIDVAVFNAISTAAIIMTGPAIFALWQTYRLGGFDQIGDLEGLAAEHGWFGDWQAGLGWELLVILRVCVADKAIHRFRCGGRIFAHIRPAITRVARRASCLVGGYIAAEGVNDIAFAQLFARFFRCHIPISNEWNREPGLPLPCGMRGRPW